MRNGLAVILLISLATIANASTDTFVADSSADVSMSASGGYYEESTYDLTPSGPSALRARITLGQFENNPIWAPSFQFALLNNKDDYVAFQIAQLEPDKLTVFFRRYHNKTDKTTMEFRFRPHESESFTLSMNWTAEGRMKASVGHDGDTPEQHEIELGFAPQQLRILASGGALSIKPLQLGHIEPVLSAWTNTLRRASFAQPILTRPTRTSCASTYLTVSLCQRIR